MTVERFRPIQQEIKRPTGKEVQPSGFSVISEDALNTQSPPRRFRFDLAKWLGTGGYPPISGGAESVIELRELYKEYLQSLFPDEKEEGIEEAARFTFKREWEQDEKRREEMAQKWISSIMRNVMLKRALAEKTSLEEK